MYIKYESKDMTGKRLLRIEKLDFLVMEVNGFYHVYNAGTQEKLYELLEYMRGEITESMAKLKTNAEKQMTRLVASKPESSGGFASYCNDKIHVCKQEFLSKQQFDNFMKILETAITNNDNLFDATAITLEDIGEE